MTIGIKVTARTDDPRFMKNMDFEVYIDGETDNTLYRMEEGSKGFKKLFSVGKKYTYAVRGNKRAVVQKLVDQIFNTNISFAVAVVDE